MPLTPTHDSPKCSLSARLSLSNRSVSLSRTSLAFAALLVAFSAISTPDEKPALVVVSDRVPVTRLRELRAPFQKSVEPVLAEVRAEPLEVVRPHLIHRAIGTGLDPRHHGILSNRRFDGERRRSLYSSDDPASHWVGPPAETPKIAEEPASPILLDGASLGDRLKEKFPQARVVSVALKDRAAVFMGGRKADEAVWLPEGFGRFVTSTYYPPRRSDRPKLHIN